jgi:FkbM family methyltransferase
MSALQKMKGFAYGRAAVIGSVLKHPLNRGSKLRALRDYAIWNMARFLMDARIVVNLTEGLEIILSTKENYGSAVYAHGLADYSEMLFLAHLLRKDDLFVDVGGNVGMYSVWVAGVTGARAMTFEPVPSTYEKLLRNIRLNGLEGRIEARRAAIGQETGFVSMTSNHGGLDHVVETQTETSVQVPVVRLDEVCLGRSPTAMKIDVEGYEMNALMGGRDALSKPSLKAVVIELQDWTLRRFGTSEEDVRRLLAGYGFVRSHYDPIHRKLLPTAEKESLNEIFVRADDEVRKRLGDGPRISVFGRPGI